MSFVPGKFWINRTYLLSGGFEAFLSLSHIFPLLFHQSFPGHVKLGLLLLVQPLLAGLRGGGMGGAGALSTATNRSSSDVHPRPHKQVFADEAG